MASTLADDQPQVTGAAPVLEGYRIEREIGRGGLGRVFLAWDLALERHVALKELLDPDSIALARFEREARITARLQHPGIIPIYQAGRSPLGEPFYAMRFVEGQTLEARLQGEPTLEGRLRLVPFVLAAVDAVAYAHHEGVVHRDLKPANVLCGAFGETVVIDWGIASERGHRSSGGPQSSHTSALTWSGEVSGTPGYMSPEQRRGDPAEPSDDLYSLGATLFHVVAGERPGVPRLSAEAQGALARVPPDLLAILNRAMHEEPSWRYASASELAEDLRQWLAGRRVSAFDYSAFALLRRWVLRHRAVVSIALLGVLGAGLAAGLGLAGMERERRVATERSWQLTMLQARSALVDDPTAAVGWLVTLPEAYQPASARALAAVALERGVSRHVMRGHDGSISGLCFAGPQLLSVDLRRLFRWSLETGQPTLELPVADESQLMRCSADGRWAVWDESSAIGVASLPAGTTSRLEGHGGLVNALALDGQTLYSASSDGSLRRWTLGTGSSEVLGQGEVALGALALDPPRQRVATGDAHGGVTIRDARSGAVLRQLELHEGAISSLAYTADGRLVSAGHDGRVEVLGPELGEARPLCHLGHPVEIAVGRERAITFGEGLPILEWDLARGTSTQLRESGETPSEAIISADDAWVAASDAQGIHLWRAGAPPRLLRGHAVAPRRLAFSPDGHWLASAGHDSQVRLWALRVTEDRELLQLRGSAGPVEFSLDGAHLLAAASSGEVAWLEVNGPGRVALARHDGPVHDVTVSRDARLAASVGTDLKVQLVELDTGVSRFLTGHRARISSVGFGEGWLATAADDGVRTWQLAPPHASQVLSSQTSLKALVSPDGRALASNSFGGEVLVWAMPGGEVLRRLPLPQYAQGLAWSADSRFLATGSWDRVVRSWPLDGSAPVVLGTTEGRPRRVAWDPRGRFVVSATNLGELDVWGLDGSHASGLGHHDVIRSLGLTPDGLRAVTSAYDGSIGVWSLPGAELLAWHEQRPSADQLAISPGGEGVVVSSGDGRFVLWRLDPSRELPSGAPALRAGLLGRTSARIDAATGQSATPRASSAKPGP